MFEGESFKSKSKKMTKKYLDELLNPKKDHLSDVMNLVEDENTYSQEEEEEVFDL